MVNPSQWNQWILGLIFFEAVLAATPVPHVLQEVVLVQEVVLENATHAWFNPTGLPSLLLLLL